jgi:CDP-6-deoxy-D-xylo-4-hexulose-3-dehydrase
MKNFYWKLMHNNILPKDKKALITFIKSSDNFTNGPKVKQFEKNWSKWLGVRYSTFVNSGASANFLSLNILKELNKNKVKKKNEIIVPAFTWNSDVVSILNAGYKPIFVDISLKNLALDENLVKKTINKRTLAIFLTHAMGFSGISENLLKYIKSKKIFLIEDVCESHGAKLKDKKVGTLGDISNFSFYYAHHMTTIEGGMISTNSKHIDTIAKMKRGHGLLRESQNIQLINKTKKKNKDLNSDFIFYTEGFNLRSNELSAVIGIEQLKRLNRNIKERNSNHSLFLKYLRKDIFFTDFHLEGSSNYALHLILKEKNKELFKKLTNLLDSKSIEYRIGSAGGGNQLRQPYLKKLKYTFKNINFKNTEHMHFYSLYVGNYPGLRKEKIINLCKLLDQL